jgi:murein DD-endopeptidase MepM/ murein hydrolase activator NlpD
LTEADTAPGARTRHWLIDAALGGLAALGAITMAKAALPEPTPVVLTPILAAPSPPHEPEPVELIAFVHPVPGHEVVSPFGLRQMPWEAGGRLHAGLDIAAPQGATVTAAADGVVARAGVDRAYGRFVELEHAEGLTSFYAHMSATAPQIAPGAKVKAGAAVGRVGSTGASTGPHLHFEIRDDRDRPMNPALFIGRRFAQAEDLPLRDARKVPGRVRVAQVSRVPDGKRGLMKTRLAVKAEASAALSADAAAEDASARAPAAVQHSVTVDGVKVLRLERPRATLEL